MQRGSKTNRLLDFWIGIPLLNLLATFKRRHPQPASPSRIGVLCSPALGDTLLFSASLQDIRARYPHAHIIHFCMKNNLAAAEMIPGADERVVITLTTPYAAVRTIRSFHLDAFFDFSSWQRLTALLSLFSGAAFTAGFCTPGQYRGRAYDLIHTHRNDQHELDNFRDLAFTLKIPVRATPLVRLARPLVEPLLGEGDLIAFHLWASGNRSNLREWPEDRWIELARRLGEPRTLFVITGGPEDRPRMDAFVEQMHAAGLRAVAFIGPDGFISLAAVLRRARLLVSVNTGVMHLGAILGAPTLSLNGPTADHRWGARGRFALGVEPADGSGGFLNLGFEFDGQPEDVTQRITIDQVEAAAKALLAASAEAKAYAGAS